MPEQPAAIDAAADRADPPAPAAEASWRRRLRPEVERGLSTLKEAVTTFRPSHRAWLLLAGVFFLPAAFIESCAVASVTGPVVAAELAAFEAEDSPRQEDRPLPRSRVELGLRTAVGHGLTGSLLHGLGAALVFVALALALADHLAAREEPTWQEAARRAATRLGSLALPIALAAILLGLSFALLRLSGLFVAALLAFVPAVALFERGSPVEILRRSVALARMAPGAVGVIIAALVTARAVSSGLAALLMPRSGLRSVTFLTSFLGDLLFLPAVVVAAIACTRLYLALRREREGADPATLAATLDSPAQG